MLTCYLKSQLKIICRTFITFTKILLRTNYSLKAFSPNLLQSKPLNSQSLKNKAIWVSSINRLIKRSLKKSTIRLRSTANNLMLNKDKTYLILLVVPLGSLKNSVVLTLAKTVFHSLKQQEKSLTKKKSRTTVSPW